MVLPEFRPYDVAWIHRSTYGLESRGSGFRGAGYMVPIWYRVGLL